MIKKKEREREELQRGSRGDEGCGKEAVEGRLALFPLCGFVRRRGSARERKKESKKERRHCVSEREVASRH